MASPTSWDHLSPPTQIRHRAQILAAEHTRMLSELVQIRVNRGMKQADVAAILGTSQQSVSKMESYDANPTLDTLQNYANAVGAMIDITVREDGSETSTSLTEDHWKTSDKLPRSAAVTSRNPQDALEHMNEWSGAESVPLDGTRIDFALGA